MARSVALDVVWAATRRHVGLAAMGPPAVVQARRLVVRDTDALDLGAALGQWELQALIGRDRPVAKHLPLVGIVHGQFEGRSMQQLISPDLIFGNSSSFIASLPILRIDTPPKIGLIKKCWWWTIPKCCAADSAVDRVRHVADVVILERNEWLCFG